MWLEIYRCLGPWVLRDPWTLNLEILWYGLLWEGGGYEIIQVKCRWRDFNLIQLRKVSWVVLVGGIAIIASSFRSRFFRDLRQTSDLAPSLTISLCTFGGSRLIVVQFLYHIDNSCPELQKPRRCTKNFWKRNKIWETGFLPLWPASQLVNNVWSLIL